MMNWPKLALLLLPLYLTSVQSQNRILLRRPGKVFDAEPPKRIFIESTLPHAHQRYLPPGSDDVSSGPRAIKNDQRGKSYEFSYAVKDGDHGDDFFHKERRQGKVTTGEYSVLLPDGRTQVVKYTSDAKDGYKADVSYQGEPTIENAPTHQPQNQLRNQPYQPQIVTAIPRQISSNHGHAATESPIFLSYPLKARRPSLSPSVLYNAAARDFSNFNSLRAPTATPKSALYSKHALFIPNPTNSGPTKATQTYYRPSPTTYSATAVQPSPTAYLRPTPQYTAVLQKASAPTPSYQPQHQLSFKTPIWGRQISGGAPKPTRSAPIASPTYASHVTSPVAYEVQKVASSIHQNTEASHQQSSQSEKKYSSHNSNLKPTSKSKLIPIEFFKAGPATKSPPVSKPAHGPTRTVFSQKSGRFYSVAASPSPQETITVVRQVANNLEQSPALQVVHPGSSGSLSPFQGQQQQQQPRNTVVNSYEPQAPQPRFVFATQRPHFEQAQHDHLSLRNTFLAQNQQERKSFATKYDHVPSSVHHYKSNQPDFGETVAY